MNGHSDVVGGAVVAATGALHEEVAWWANCTGASGAPFDAWLTLRGLRTLHARMRLHEENATALAHLLDAHPAVTTVHLSSSVRVLWVPLIFLVTPCDRFNHNAPYVRL